MFDLFGKLLTMLASQLMTFVLGMPAILTLPGLITPGFSPLVVQAMTIPCNLQNLDDLAMKTPESGQCMVDQLNQRYHEKRPNGTKNMTLMDLQAISQQCSGPIPRPVCMVNAINKYFFRS